MVTTNGAGATACLGRCGYFTPNSGGFCDQCLKSGAHKLAPLEASSEEPIGGPVNHPTHYNAHPSGVEAITIVEHMTFNSGNAVKYIWRSGQKENVPTIQDLKKARWYIDREIARLEKQGAT